MNAVRSSANSARNIGKHRLVAGLGKGGMARVYLALAQNAGGFNKLLVLKILRPELDSGEFVEMFMQEARLAARLNHPNVVQTYEVGEDDGRHYIAMEYLEGQALSSLLRQVGRDKLPLEVHLRILCDALEGLDYAHDLTDYDGTPLDIVHRDVSPQNVFVTYTGQSKILDFGIAKASGSSHTRTGVLKGKAAYMAPEQVSGKLDRRADIFAVGVMLWEAIARRRFINPGEDDVVVLTRRIGGRDPKIREVVPDVAPALADICDRALSTDPEARFATAGEMRSAIEAHLRDADPVDARSVARVLDEAYADERRRIRRLVDDQVRRADDTGPMVDIRTQEAVTPPMREAGFDVPVDVSDAQPDPAPTAIVPARRKAVVPIVVGALVVLLLGASFALRPRAREVATAAPVSAPAPVSSISAAPVVPLASSAEVATTSPALIRVAIRATPATATVQLDGKPVGNPYVVEVAADGSRHALVVTAPGHSPESSSIVFDAPRDISVALPPVAVAPRQAPGEVDLTNVKTKRPKRVVDEKDPY